ncbi:ABC transporter ATP-binding protein [Pseudoclavibacter sp. CFCC 14310]|uniref:ABC transporter ATP-binding protein n=1 Tax=Pseudoclavibacter sp. CFCC 14310 TaxID=2615180 RepID=UPI001CE4A05E|nr:ABC transporter ATP-binding protein [Pseudoclavibacter sp. CFCC 14310]
MNTSRQNIGVSSAAETGAIPEDEIVHAPEMIARFARLVSKPARGQLTLTLVLAIVSGVLRGIALVVLLPAAVALAMGETIWGLPVSGWLWTFAVLAVLGMIAEYWLAITNYTVALDLVKNVHRRIGDRLTRLPLGWFRDSAAGRMSRLVSHEVLMLGESLAHLLASMASNAATAAVMVIGSWIWDWRLGLVLTIAVPFYLGALWLGRKAITRGKRISEPAEEDLGDRIVEYARCQGALRSTGRSGDFEPLRAANERSVVAGRTDLWWGTLALMLHGLVGQFIVVAMITIAVRLALGEAMGPIETIAFIGLSLRFMQTLEDLGGMVVANEERKVMVENVNEILTTPGLPAPATSAESTAPGRIEVDHVDFGYDAEHQVLHDVSFEVSAGSMCALVGPSGCGKTTVAKLVARFYDVDRGVVRVGGADVRDQTTADLMAQLSMVFQDVYLFDDTLEANIRVGDESATDAEIQAAGDLAGVTEIVRRLPDGWQTRVGEGGHALSGGERQRVSIARALLKHAPIVLLDEATSALDPENEAHVMASMQHLRKEATLLVIAHKLDTIRSADQIVVLGHNGHVEQRGTHDELIAQPGQYRSFCEARAAASGWRLV